MVAGLPKVLEHGAMSIATSFSSDFPFEPFNR